MADRNLPTTPDVVSVTIPAEYVEDFRAALVREIAASVKAVQDDYRSLDEAEGWLPDKVKFRRADLECATGLLVADAALLAGMGANATGLTGEDVELQADADTIAHGFESMARVIELRLRDIVDCSPIDAKYAGKARHTMERLQWAADRAGEFHKKGVELREKVAA